MRTPVMVVATLFLSLLLAAPESQVSAASWPIPNPETPQTASPAPDAKATTPSLVGTWRSAPERLGLTTEFDVSVWGPNASSERVVEMTMGASGRGTLVVTRRVVDGKGRTVKASTSIEQAEIVVGAAQPSSVASAVRVDHEVKVTHAERRYPDDPTYSWPLDGLAVKIATFQDGDPAVLEVRVDTPEGRGSFWETLRRGGQRPSTDRTPAATKGRRPQ